MEWTLARSASSGVDSASPSVAAKITPPAVCSGGMQHITLYVLPVTVVMNHLHNGDRCRIVSGRQKIKNKGENEIAFAIAWFSKNLCPKVKHTENNKCQFFNIKRQHLILSTWAGRDTSV